MSPHCENVGGLHEYSSPGLGIPFRGNRPVVLTIM